MKFVSLHEDWRSIWKRASVTFASILAMIQLFGPEIQAWWLTMPTELKEVIPDNVQRGIKYALIFGSFVALQFLRFNFKGNKDDRSSQDALEAGSSDPSRPDGDSGLRERPRE